MRMYGVLLILTAALTAAACTGSVDYEPDFVPVTLSLDSDGQFSVTRGAHYTTPIGRFSANVGVKRDLKKSDTRLILVHRIGGVEEQEVFDIHEKDISLCLDGRFLQAFHGNEITLRALDGVSTIEVIGGTMECAGSIPGGAAPGGGIARPAPDLAGTWVGTYTCSQGITGLRLRIRAGSGDGLTAQFDFHALPSNPNVPSGSFAMIGSHSGNSVSLHGDRWLKQPAGYTMVDLSSASVSDEGSSISGAVSSNFSGCTTFFVERS